jgi:hypothetical protein
MPGGWTRHLKAVEVLSYLASATNVLPSRTVWLQHRFGLEGVRGSRVPAMKKYRKRLPYRLATKRHGFIEEHMLHLLGQAAPKLAGSPSQRDEEFFLGLISSHQRPVRNDR